MSCEEKTNQLDFTSRYQGVRYDDSLNEKVANMFEREQYHLTCHNLLKGVELSSLCSAQAAYSNHGYALHK